MRYPKNTLYEQASFSNRKRALARFFEGTIESALYICVNFFGTKAGALFEIEKGRQLAEALKMSNQDLSSAPIFKRRFKQKAAFTEEFKKGADPRTVVV